MWKKELAKRKLWNLFEQGLLDNMQARTFETLSKIHKYLFYETMKVVTYIELKLANYYRPIYNYKNSI